MARNRNVFCILPECLQNDFLWLSGFIEADSRQEGRREPVVDLSLVFRFATSSAVSFYAPKYVIILVFMFLIPELDNCPLFWQLGWRHQRQIQASSKAYPNRLIAS